MDDRDFPLTMNKPERHQFALDCKCEGCVATRIRQQDCQAQRGHSMIGKHNKICVHCGCTEQSQAKYAEQMSPQSTWNFNGIP